MSRPLNRKRGETKSLILSTAAKMFIENIYSKTTMNELAKNAGITYGELFRVVQDKETLLCNLVGHVLECQFEKANEVLNSDTDNLIKYYAFETVLQLHIAESNENMREMYSVSYSLPHAAEVVYRTITKNLEVIFKDRLPNLETKDFYELEIAAAGIMRSYITVPCNIYFTMERKIKRFLETTFSVYRLSDEEINRIIEFLSKYDFKKYALEVQESLFNYLESKI